MLSDRDRETLREVQRRLVNDDPAFARSFAVDEQDVFAWLTAIPRWVFRTAFVVMVLLAVLMLVARAPGTALWCAVIAGVVWTARQRRDRDAIGRNRS